MPKKNFVFDFSIYESIPEALVIANPQGKILFINEIAQEKTKNTQANLTGKDISELFPEINLEFFRNKIISATGRKSIQLNLNTSDGLILTKASFTQSINSITGKQQITIIFHSIEASNELIKNNKETEILSILAENSQSGIWAIDKNFKIIFANSTFKEEIKVKHQANIRIGDNILDKLKDKTQKEQWKNRYQSALNGKTQIVEEKSSHNDKDKYSEIRISPININGINNGVLCFSKYKSDVKESSRGVQSSNLSFESFKRILQYSANNKIDLLEYILQEAVIQTNSQIGYLITIDKNQSKFSILSSTKDITIPESLIDLNLNEMGIWADVFRKRQAFIDNNFTPRDIEIQHPLIVRLSEKIKRIIAIPIYEDGKITAIISTVNKPTNYSGQEMFDLIRFMESVWILVRNIDYREEIEDFASTLEKVNEELNHQIKHRKQIEIALEESKVKAESANKAKSSFLANMSHEIRTPLNAIIGFSEILKDKIKESEYKDYLESIRSSSKSLLILINDILDLSKIEAGKLEIYHEYINLHDLFKEIGGIFSIKLKQKNIEYLTTMNSNFPASIKIDEIRLRQILVNLVGNAVKFTKKGRIELIATYTPVISLEEKLTEGKLKIEVIDTGVGITDEFQKKLFKAFSQEKQINESEGTGLGLAISRKLVELLGGKIKVKSKLEEGSVFTLTFNHILASSQPINRPKQDIIESKNIQFLPSRVLIVDDNEQNNKYIGSALKDTKLELMIVRNGKDALDIISDFKPRLILTDLKMPVMDGFQLLSSLRKNQKHSKIPVIASTAFALNSEKKQIQEHGFNDILIKPFSVKSLITLLSKFLPFKKHKVDNKTEDRSEYKFKKSTIINIDELIQVLEEKEKTVWVNFQQQQPINEVTKFGQDLINIGEKHKFIPLVNFGTQLITAVKRFDVGKIIEIINDFPEIITKLK